MPPRPARAADVNQARADFALALISAEALNRLLRGRRRHLAGLAVMLCLGGAVAVHHISIDDMAMDGAMVACLAVLPVVGVAAVSVLRRRLPGLRRLLPPASAQRAIVPPVPRARSSPVATVVLRL